MHRGGEVAMSPANKLLPKGLAGPAAWLGMFAFPAFLLADSKPLLAETPLPQVDSEQIALGIFDYKTVLMVEETRMDIDARIIYSRASDEDGDYLLILSLSDTGLGRTEDRLALDGATLSPQARDVRQNDGHMQVRYGREQVSAQIRSGDQSVSVELDLDQAVFGGEAGLEAALAALPLAEGYQARLRAVEVDVQTLVRSFEIEVDSAETIQVPAGEFSVWPVHLRALDGLGGDQWLWFSQSTPRFLVRAEAELPSELGTGLLITELINLDLTDP